MVHNFSKYIDLVDNKHKKRAELALNSEFSLGVTIAQDRLMGK